MSTPGSHDDDPARVDPAAEQALPADTGADAPEGDTVVHDVPATGADAGSRAMGDRSSPGDAEDAGGAATSGASASGPVTTGGSAPTTGPSDAVSGQRATPAKASADGPSGTGMGSPGGIPASVTDKLPVDAEVLQQKPELLVGGAFVGGFLVAKVLRRIAGV